MIIWINGAFGSGKTQTSYELHRRIPNSVVFDPEKTGFFINKNIPTELSKPDFQDHSVWRELNYTTLKYIASEYNGVIIVPMTLVNPQYFEENNKAKKGWCRSKSFCSLGIQGNTDKETEK